RCGAHSRIAPVCPRYARSPHTRVSSPCRRSGSTAGSATLAAVATAVWMIFVLLSTPTCAFIPKYHCLPFFVWCISGSRCCSRFLVEVGACRMVASTIVPVVIRTPCACRCRFTCPQDLFPQLVFFQQVPELAHRGLVRHRLTAQINAHELPHHPRVVQRLFYRRVRQVEPLLQKVNPQHALYSHRWPPVPRLGIMRRHQPAQLAPRHHLLHLLQKYRSPR